MRFVGVVALAFALSGCAAELQHNLDENSANDTMALLHEHGIAADKVERGRSGWTVTVPRGERSRAWGIVRDSGLADGPLTEETELLPSPAQRRAGMASTVSRRLEGSLEMLTGVVDARVHLTLPAAQRVQIPGTVGARPRASVLLRMRGANPEVSAQCRDLVLGAVEGMVASDVRVVVVKSPPPTAATTEVVPMGPLAVSSDSVGPLRAVLGGLAAAVVLLSGAVIVLLVRIRRRRTA